MRQKDNELRLDSFQANDSISSARPNFRKELSKFSKFKQVINFNEIMGITNNNNSSMNQNDQIKRSEKNKMKKKKKTSKRLMRSAASFIDQPDVTILTCPTLQINARIDQDLNNHSIQRCQDVNDTNSNISSHITVEQHIKLHNNNLYHQLDDDDDLDYKKNHRNQLEEKQLSISRLVNDNNINYNNKSIKMSQKICNNNEARQTSPIIVRKSLSSPTATRKGLSPARRLSLNLISLILCALSSQLLLSTTRNFLQQQQATSNYFSITSVSAEQRFEAQPEREYLVPSGQEVRLRCLVRERQGECLWLRNGRVIGNIARKYKFEKQPEDGDCSLLIRNVSVQLDDGLWQCQVTQSELGEESLQSREMQLIVLVAPESPQIKNTTATTSVQGATNQAQSHSSLANQFNQATSSVANNLRLTQSRLKLSDIRRSMNGKNLTCIGIHPTGNQSTSVELDVQYLPTVSVVQREYSIVEGSPLSISCQVDANPPPNLINWRLVNDATSPNRALNIAAAAALQHHNSGQHQHHHLTALHQRGGQPEALGQSSSAASSISLPTRPGPILEFERISRDLNQNVFECLAQNAYGISLPADVKLNVLYAPYLVNTSNSESVPVGSDAQLACIFDGNPEPEIKWFYTDPLSRLATASQLSEPNHQMSSSSNANNNHRLLNNLATSSRSQQFLNIKNVTYRNEGDYHCEARNQINGVYYGVRSSNIILDVFGEPQFLVKSPIVARAIRGTKSDISVTFCSDPAPNKVFWQFGSIRLEVRLNGTTGHQNNDPTINQPSRSIASLLLSQLGGGSSTTHTNGQASPPSGGHANKQQSSSAAAAAQANQAAIHQRFQVHPLQALQRRDSAFSKSQTCFEAKLSLLDPELTDERDYMLTVQNERGHQSATVRLQVSSPLSPMLIISSGLVTICAFFLISILLLFFVRTRQAHHSSMSNGSSGTNGNGNGANGNGLTSLDGLSDEVNGIKSENGNGHLKSSLSKKNKLINGSTNAAMNASVEHLANGNGHMAAANGNGLGAAIGNLSGQTNGIGSGHANQASNLNSLHHHSSISMMSDRLSISDNGGGNSIVPNNNEQQANNNKLQHQHQISISSSSEISSHNSGNDQRQLIGTNQSVELASPLGANGLSGVTSGTSAGGVASPGLSSLNSQLSSASGSSSAVGRTNGALDSHANIDFNLQTSTLASSNSISSAASSTILRSAYNNSQQQFGANHHNNHLHEQAEVLNGLVANSTFSDHENGDQHQNSDQQHQYIQNKNMSTYRAAESVTRGVNLIGSTGNNNDNHQFHDDKNAIIYANIDCNSQENGNTANLMSQHSANSSCSSRISTNHKMIRNDQQVGAGHNQQTSRAASGMTGPVIKSKVGATIAMMNSLAAAQSINNQATGGLLSPISNGTTSTATMGALNGAIRQHHQQQQLQQQNGLAINQMQTTNNRKQGPPKPPKPMIQEASRFYEQAAAAAAAAASSGNGTGNGFARNNNNRHGTTPSRDELAAEYSRLAFPERAEL